MNKTKRDLAEAREQLELEKTSNLAYLEAEKAVRLFLFFSFHSFLVAGLNRFSFSSFHFRNARKV